MEDEKKLPNLEQYIAKKKFWLLLLQHCVHRVKASRKKCALPPPSGMRTVCAYNANKGNLCCADYVTVEQKNCVGTPIKHGLNSLHARRLDEKKTEINIGFFSVEVCFGSEILSSESSVDTTFIFIVMQ